MSRPLAPPAPSSAFMEEVGRDLRALPTRPGSLVGPVQQEYTKTLVIAERWLRVVEERRLAANGSASDQARWSAYTAAVSHGRVQSPHLDSLVMLLATVQDMLKDLRDTQPPCPTVAQVAAHIRHMIETDPAAYPPGARVPVLPLVKKLGIPRKNLNLSLADLRNERVLDPSTTGMVRVRAIGPAGERRLDVAGWLRTLIRTGVYPPGHALPPRDELVRTLAIGHGPVGNVISALDYEGSVRRHHGKPPEVLAHLSAQPFDLARTLRPLEELPPPPGERGLEASARRARQWWGARVRPPSTQLEIDLGVLRAGVRELIPPVHRPHRGAAALVARAAVTAAEPLPRDDHQKLWRAALLAIAVQDLQAEPTSRAL